MTARVGRVCVGLSRSCASRPSPGASASAAACSLWKQPSSIASASTPCRFFSEAPRGGIHLREPSSRDEQQGTLWSKLFKWLLPPSLALAAWYMAEDTLDEFFYLGKPLNEKSFVPFVITSREQVSPTSFILTVRPKHYFENSFGRSVFFPTSRYKHDTHSHRSVLEQAWKHGLWSVEIKQPQIQVARDYTPLPAPSLSAENLDLQHGGLRFLIRKMDGGEVSTYLSGLGVGDTVELRGPHLGFDVRARLGAAEKVVFLAGGTGIAPALQAIRAVLDPATASAHYTPQIHSVSILWANRNRADCPGIPSLQGALPKGVSEEPNAITTLLSGMKDRYGEKRLRLACTVDEEKSFISAKDILALTQPKKSPASALAQPPIAPCAYHSPTALASSAGHDLFQEAKADTAGPNKKACACAGAGGEPVHEPGKNLLMVSGPEGFINVFAGPKRWAEGKELQGPVGGMIRKLMGEMLGRDWLVLKL